MTQGDALDDRAEELVAARKMLYDTIKGLTVAQRSMLTEEAKAWWEAHQLLDAMSGMRRPPGLTADELWVALGSFASDVFDLHYEEGDSLPFSSLTMKALTQWKKM